MSTVVYGAYRLRRAGTFWEVARDIQVWGRAGAKVLLQKRYDQLADHIKPAGEAYDAALQRYAKWGADKAEAMARLELAHDFAVAAYRKQLTEVQNSPFDFRALVTVYHHKRNFYLKAIAGGGLPNCFEFLDKDARLESYCYDSRGDRPESISHQDWSGRSKVWHEIDKQVRAGVYATLPIVDNANFNDVDPFWPTLRARFIDNPLTG